MNTYLYVGANPISYIDPLGLTPYYGPGVRPVNTREQSIQQIAVVGVLGLGIKSAAVAGTIGTISIIITGDTPMKDIAKERYRQRNNYTGDIKKYN